MMQLLDLFLSLRVVRERLVDLGWAPPVDTKGGGGPKPPPR